MHFGDYTNKKNAKQMWHSYRYINRIDYYVGISISNVRSYFTSNPVKIMLLMELRTKTKVVKSNFLV